MENMETPVLTPLHAAEYSVIVNFGGILLDAGWLSNDNLQAFYLNGYRSDIVTDVYSQWLGFSAPIAGAPNWNEFVSYALEHRFY